MEAKNNIEKELQKKRTPIVCWSKQIRLMRSEVVLI